MVLLKVRFRNELSIEKRDLHEVNYLESTKNLSAGRICRTDFGNAGILKSKLQAMTVVKIKFINVCYS